jgi:beta-galactosidase
MALGHDTMRGLKDKPFWVMEQQAGPGGWDIVSVTPKPGELRLWAYQAVAHGADGIVFFRWRSARYGTEQYWHGLLEHDARPGRRYVEIKKMGQEMKSIGEHVVGASVKAEVAMMLSYDSRFALQIQPNNPRFSYPEQVMGLYKALYKKHVAVDVVSPEADLSKYKVVVAPSLYVLTQETATTLERFVENGGVLLVTPRTGVKDETNAVVNEPLPGLLSRLCGVSVEDYDSLPAGVTTPLEFVSGAEGACGEAWCDILAPGEAEVVARYSANYYAGKPAVTVNAFGEGKAFYAGTAGNEVLYETLAHLLLDETGLTAEFHVPKGVEVSRRQRGDKTLVFVLNHTDGEQVVHLDGTYVSLLGAAPADGSLTVGPRDVVILEGGSHA